MRGQAFRIGFVGLAGSVGLVVLALAASGRAQPGFLLPIPVELAIGWSFVSAGLIGWARRPDNGTGLLMFMCRFSWTAQSRAKSPPMFTR